MLKTWVKSLNGSNPNDLRIWIPKAFLLNWSDPKTWQTRFFDPTIWLPVAFSTPEERERIMNVLNVAGNVVLNAGNMAGGDMNSDISNANIVNRSLAQNSFNEAKKDVVKS
jgi:hypothetical protein